MLYRKDKYGNSLSALGFGCMRFPMKAGRIDMAKTEQQILAAIDQGINYFDTAYVYGGSEAALGQILAKHQLRGRVNIATKLPHYLIKSRAGMEKYFDEQLRRLQTDHIDYYLMHMLTDLPTWEKLKGLGILDFLEEKKASGAIRQIGFSYHGNTDMFCQLVDAYDWDFCQIQYNYMDEHSQAGRSGLQYAHRKGLPVIIMEPLRGGKLVSRLPEDAKRVFREHPSRWSPARWALSWLWDQKEVTVVLSGMNSMEMLEENIRTASEAFPGCLTEEDQAVLQNALQAMNANMKVGCTGCRYCMPCPQNVDIPGTFSAYNRCFSEGKLSGRIEYAMCTAVRKIPSSASGCIGCGKCEAHCPQHIPIRQELKNASAILEFAPYRVMKKLISLLKIY